VARGEEESNPRLEPPEKEITRKASPIDLPREAISAYCHPLPHAPIIGLHQISI
jgi:hypothetical protein